MNIITFSAIKGGVGKTTLTYNFGEYLASQGKNVLFFDFDHQCNLSQIYNLYDIEGSVAGIFLSNSEAQVRKIKENISIVSGDVRLDLIEKEIENKTNKNMLFYMWLSDNYERLELESYDYLIIDTHPDFSTATKNALIVSNSIISPITPSEHGYNAKFNLEARIKELKEEAIDYASRKSYFTADLYYVANMVKHNTNSSRELIKSLEDDETVIGIIPDKELFNRSTLDRISIPSLKSDNKLLAKQGQFFQEIESTFLNIQKRVTKED